MKEKQCLYPQPLLSCRERPPGYLTYLRIRVFEDARKRPGRLPAAHSLEIRQTQLTTLLDRIHQCAERFVTVTICRCECENGLSTWLEAHEITLGCLTDGASVASA